jgi:hypothetical protein
MTLAPAAHEHFRPAPRLIKPPSRALVAWWAVSAWFRAIVRAIRER